MSLREKIVSTYAQLGPHSQAGGLPHIEPFVGSDYDRPNDRRLRVLAIGINAYISEKDFAGCHPQWFSAWAERGEHRFSGGVQREVRALADALCDQASDQQLGFDVRTGLYLTNAVKRFLPATMGKRASQVDAAWFDEGRAIWDQELRLLAAHGALPHAVVVFGADAWEPTWRVLADLCSDPSADSFVEYRPMARSSDLFHRLNVVKVLEGRGARNLALVRLDHPAAHRRWTAARMAARLDFVGAVGRG
ncbi:MAG: hypothetical protein H6698_09375 [Myxococcales bacterium]|nr:hypothetical protein [Myxococcales bacterium]MCB9534491.1 hypothetical protein [Myxococcales bacterium]